MKKTFIPLFFALLAASVRADTPLSIPGFYGCLLDFGGPVALLSPPSVTGTFALPDTSGHGVIQSQIPTLWEEHVPPANTETKLYTYAYTIDLSGVTAGTSHCVRLQIHFGDPAGCLGPGVQATPSQIQSATLGAWGDVSFVFNNGCLGAGSVCWHVL